jgi:hypothetical protein
MWIKLGQHVRSARQLPPAQVPHPLGRVAPQEATIPLQVCPPPISEARRTAADQVRARWRNRGRTAREWLSLGGTCKARQTWESLRAVGGSTPRDGSRIEDAVV